MNTWPPPPPPLPPRPSEPPPRRTPWKPEPRPVPPPTPSQTVNLGWERLSERLLEKRIVSLAGPLTVEAANQAAASLALLDASGDEPIQLRLHDIQPDPRAELDTVLTLLDTVDLVTVPVHATCLGGLDGAAVALLAVADQRVAGANALFALREPRASFSGPASEISARAEQFRRQLSLLQRRIAGACHRPVDTVIEDMRAGRVLTAEQARDYGLIDEVAAPHPAR